MVMPKGIIKQIRGIQGKADEQFFVPFLQLFYKFDMFHNNLQKYYKSRFKSQPGKNPTGAKKSQFEHQKNNSYNGLKTSNMFKSMHSQ